MPESVQIVARLRWRGVEATYEMCPDEGDHFGKRDNQVRAMSAVGEFLLARQMPEHRCAP